MAELQDDHRPEGYDPDSRAGAGAEPVGIEIRRSRAGLGAEEPVLAPTPARAPVEKPREVSKRERRQQEEMAAELRARKSTQWKGRRVVWDYRKAERALAQLEKREGNKLNPRNMIYFKVTGMEPLDEPILHVNCNETALVLGGAASAVIPPYSFFSSSGNSVPLHSEVVEHLASVIASAFSPSDILPNIKFSTFYMARQNSTIKNDRFVGCGKRTVVRHVANHLDLHVVECSCHDLITSSESGL
ncbi:D111/G-patch domain-containing protein [Zea mays]|uniref:D111/G-patch domain-containing protein n=1 Tax=Zea mays TaxID=4577 RepID=A0A1D6FN22_MAIZE|nr:D111/G-patch domain-containing protein [Zea mays]